MVGWKFCLMEVSIGVPYVKKGEFRREMRKGEVGKRERCREENR